MPSNNISRAAFWMIGAILSFTTMTIAGRQVSFALDTFEIMLFRSVVGIIIVLLIGGFAGTLSQINRDKIGLHGLRNLTHFIGQNLWFFALPAIPLAQLFALEFTSPIWVILLSPLLIGERITRIGAIAALVAFFGVLLVAQPGTAPLSWALVAAAGSAVFFALTAIFTRQLTRTASITCIMFYLTLMQLFFGLICAGFDGDIAMPNLTTAPWLILIGIAGLSAHFCLTSALSLAPANIVMPIDFARLPTIAVIGYLFYEEQINLLLVIGATLIIVANYVNIAYGQRR